MAEPKSATNENEISRERLAELLNEDLSREYQAIIAYVVYSQVLSGAQYMDICGAARDSRQAGARSRFSHLAAGRLSRQDAGGFRQTGPHLERSEGHAA